MEKILKVNGKDYEIIKLLGKGKGGYSCSIFSDCRSGEPRTWRPREGNPFS